MGVKVYCPTVSKLRKFYGRPQLCRKDATGSASNLIVVTAGYTKQRHMVTADDRTGLKIQV